jgi:hypothetical protein
VYIITATMIGEFGGRFGGEYWNISRLVGLPPMAHSEALTLLMLPWPATDTANHAAEPQMRVARRMMEREKRRTGNMEASHRKLKLLSRLISLSRSSTFSSGVISIEDPEASAEP